jgi:hypothetical protein
VLDAYENLRTNDQIVQLYRAAMSIRQQSRDISEYAYVAAPPAFSTI